MQLDCSKHLVKGSWNCGVSQEKLLPKLVTKTIGPRQQSYGRRAFSSSEMTLQKLLFL